MRSGPSKKGTEMVHAGHLSTYVNSEQAEIRSFEFFMRRLVPGFSRIVDEHFWRQLIPQLSRSDHIIWDAVIAFSCLVQHSQHSRTLVLQGSKAATRMHEERRRGLKWYNKSINGLRKTLKQANSRSVTVIISCILYICIECLQENVAEAIALYQRAVAMMGMADEHERSIAFTTQSDGSLHHTLRGLLQNMSASQRLPLGRRRDAEQSEMGFRTLVHAREELFVLLFAANEFIVHTAKIKAKQAKDWTPSTELVSRQQHFQTLFLKWQSTLEDMVGSPALLSNDAELENYTLLHVAWVHYFILLSTSLSQYETAFDNHFPIFQTIVDQARRIIDTGNEQPRPEFTFECRVIPSLFFLAAHCRHPIIRRQAISLLRSGARIENTWKADTMADLAERVVGIEESGDISGVFCSNPCDPKIPPESGRVFAGFVTENQNSDGQPARSYRLHVWRQVESFAWVRVEHLVQV